MNEYFEKPVPNALIDEILTAFYQVYNELGYGFLERVYQNAIFLELVESGLKCEAEKQIHVYYKGRIVGEYRADILIEDRLILELKACEELTAAHEAQLLNYLRSTDIEVGYVLNFGKKPTFIRKVYSNYRKKLGGRTQ